MPDDNGAPMAEPVLMGQSQDSTPVSEEADKGEVINIAEPIDPDDPSTWD